MIGAILGDIIGSRHEFTNQRSKDFELFTPYNEYTDDTVLTIAVADAIMNDKTFKESILEWVNKYPRQDYGANFQKWIYSDEHNPYNSYGNGSAMRVGAIPYLAESINDTEGLAIGSALPTHDHPEGVMGAKVIAILTRQLRRLGNKEEALRFTKRLTRHDYSILNSYISEWTVHRYNEICKHTVPASITCMMDSVSFEDAIRNAISLGGDADTLAAITGQLAQAYYGLDEFNKTYNINTILHHYLPKDMIDIILQFEEVTNERIISNPSSSKT